MATIQVRVEAVIYNKKGQLLLALHSKKGNSYWVLPGGHLEYGERLSSGLERELREELGLEHTSVSELVFVDEFLDIDKKRHVVKIGFRVEARDEDLKEIDVRVKDESIKEVCFFSAYSINQSPDTFYPDKDFFLRLIEFYSKEK